MKKRFGALRIISVLYKILAVLAFLGGIGVAILNFSIMNSPNMDPALALPMILGGLLGGLLGAVTLLAFAQLFDLMIAVEENTRATSMMLQRLGKVMQDRL
jgi:uncharacterized membrane protein